MSTLQRELSFPAVAARPEEEKLIQENNITVVLAIS
jgi:hypothetical protein